MQVKDFPYGKPTKTLGKAVKWLMANKKRLSKTQIDCFDYPNYWGMPKTICHRLSVDEVDWLQETTYDCWWDHCNSYHNDLNIIMNFNDKQKQAILNVFKLKPWEMMLYISGEFANKNYKVLSSLDFSDQL